MLPARQKFDSAAQEAYLNLWRSYDRLRALEDRLFSQWGLTAQQYNVLRLLQASAPDAVPTLSLSAKLVSRAPDITRMLDRLESSGWIKRLRPANDRRTVLVAITDSGSQLLADLAAPLEECHQAQLGHLSTPEIQTLCRLLRKARQPHEPDGSSWKS